MYVLLCTMYCTSSRCDIVLELDAPVAHLLLSLTLLHPPLLAFLSLHLAQVYGALVKRQGHLPGLSLVVRTTHDLGQHASPRDEVCE